jgi:hypothetical protein
MFITQVNEWVLANEDARRARALVEHIYPRTGQRCYFALSPDDSFSASGRSLMDTCAKSGHTVAKEKRP